jgi:hypothetical protein
VQPAHRPMRWCVTSHTSIYYCTMSYCKMFVLTKI